MVQVFRTANRVLTTARQEWQNLLSERREEITDAIDKAVAEDMQLVDLECLGLKERTINGLERRGIVSLKDLLDTPLEEIHSIPNIGPLVIRQILKAISSLPDLKEREREFARVMMPNMDDMPFIRKYGLEVAKKMKLSCC